MCSDSLEVTFQGIPAALGIAMGSSFRYYEPDFDIPLRDIEYPSEELMRFKAALQKARGRLLDLKRKAERDAGSQAAGIFDAHALFLEDPALMASVKTVVHDRLVNIEIAWDESIENYAQRMEALGDDTFRARALDIRDVGELVLKILLEIDEIDLSSLTVPSVILAEDLTPSATARLDKSFVLAFCTSKGGPTSHTAILAKAMGIPAVVGIGPSILELSNDAPLLVDGTQGEVVAFPDEETLKDYGIRRDLADALSKVEIKMADKPAITIDGYQVEVVANVGNVSDAESALNLGAEGIGLLRTEFLYLDREDAPNEEEQLAVYSTILDLMQDRPVVVRTLDVGGDKELPYLDLGQEANPFLGWRAIRMCLDRPDFFKIQLRAILRASSDHDVRIMFPMVSTIEEVRKARALLAEAREDVLKSGQPVSDKYQIGIMVEVPSVVIMADQFAQEVDFFSIGTNDLTQYTMAAERVNEKVSGLNDPCHPAILRQIEHVIKTAHQGGIWVGLCGEMAGDPEAVPILLGLGLDEFSMAPASIPRIKALVRLWTLEDARQLAAEVVNLGSAEEVRERVRRKQEA